MDDNALAWREVVIEDPDGGDLVLWPHLPCVIMPSKVRSRKKWDGLALTISKNDFLYMMEDYEREKESPGANVEAAISSGTLISRLLKDLRELDIDGPHIPDPEPVRLVSHAENARGGLPIFLIEPEIDDEMWFEWLSKCAEMEVKIGSLLSRLTTSKRWRKYAQNAVSLILKDSDIDSELGAASATCYAWEQESNKDIGEELISEKNVRLASRIRGALADLRSSSIDDDETSQPTLMVPVHQARLPSLARAINNWPEPETIRRMKK